MAARHRARPRSVPRACAPGDLVGNRSRIFWPGSSELMTKSPPCARPARPHWPMKAVATTRQAEHQQHPTCSQGTHGIERLFECLRGVCKVDDDGEGLTAIDQIHSSRNRRLLGHGAAQVGGGRAKEPGRGVRGEPVGDIEAADQPRLKPQVAHGKRGAPRDSSMSVARTSAGPSRPKGHAGRCAGRAEELYVRIVGVQHGHAARRKSCEQAHLGGAIRLEGAVEVVCSGSGW